MSFTYQSFNTIKHISSHSAPPSHLSTLLSCCSIALPPSEKRRCWVTLPAPPWVLYDAGLSHLVYLPSCANRSNLSSQGVCLGLLHRAQRSSREAFICNSFELPQHQMVGGSPGQCGWLESVTVQIPLAKGQKEGEYYLPGSEQMDLFPEGKIYFFSAILNIPPQNSGFLHQKHFQMQNEHTVCDHQQLDNNMSSPDPATGKERKRPNCLKLRPFVGIFFKAYEFWERSLK